LLNEKNCWETDRADRATFLIDAEKCFSAVRQAILQACHSVYILAWDIDSQIMLRRNAKADGYAERLGDFLNDVARDRPELHIYILDWDFAVIYTNNRELMPIYHLNWKTHARVHFALDSQHPSGASHHQKVVVVDDQIAFVGGLDMTRGRWDTSDHAPDDSRRDIVDGKLAPPYHDAQLMVSGPIAAKLGNLARQRWLTAQNERLDPPPPSNTIWPDGVPVDMCDAMVGVARTRAGSEGVQEIREIQQLYLDVIAAAQRSIYIENQYFTAPLIADAILKRLKESNGPEIVILVPLATDGWLSRLTMDVLRVRQFQRLLDHDRHNRLRVYYADRAGLEQTPIMLHAKILVADERVAIVGSANLNNRSMALDSECNLVVDTNGNRVQQQAVANFRNRLIAEHTGATLQQVTDTFEREGSLHAVIDQLNGREQQQLRPLPLDLPPEMDRMVPQTEVVDPEHPISPELILPQLLPEEQETSARQRLFFWLSFIGIITLLAILWQWTPLAEWANSDAAYQLIEELRTTEGAWLWVVALFLVAGLTAFPFSILVLATVAVFGPLVGFFCSMVGGMLSAVVVYGLGEMLGRGPVRKLAGPRLNKVSQKVARHGIITIIAVRIVPVAPFTVINLVAGASHINFRDYLLGTLVGMTPGMLALILVADRVQAVITRPDPLNAALLLATVTILAVCGRMLILWLQRQPKEKENSPS